MLLIQIHSYCTHKIKLEHLFFVPSFLIVLKLNLNTQLNFGSLKVNHLHLFAKFLYLQICSLFPNQFLSGSPKCAIKFLIGSSLNKFLKYQSLHYVLHFAKNRIYTNENVLMQCVFIC